MVSASPRFDFRQPKERERRDCGGRARSAKLSLQKIKEGTKSSAVERLICLESFPKKGRQETENWREKASERQNMVKIEGTDETEVPMSAVSSRSPSEGPLALRRLFFISPQKHISTRTFVFVFSLLCCFFCVFWCGRRRRQATFVELAPKSREKPSPPSPQPLCWIKARREPRFQ